MNVECALGCGRPLNPYDEGTWKEVTGFVGGPGKDSMTLRRDTGRHAHNACVEKAKSGQTPDQPSLFGDEPAPPELKRCGSCGRPLPHTPPEERACMVSYYELDKDGV